MAARTRLYRRPVGWCDPRLPAPEGVVRQRGHARRHRAGFWEHRLAGGDYGVCLDGWPGEHDPGHVLQSAEPRTDLSVRGRRIHYPRGTLGQPDQWGIDESGALIRPGPGALELFQLLDLHRGSDRWCAASRWHRLYSAGSWDRHPGCAGKIGGGCG